MLIVQIIFFVLSGILILFYVLWFFFTATYARRAYYGGQKSLTGFPLPTVTLVIPTYNERDNVEKKIRNVESLDYPRDKLEVVFVDSSTDGTRDIIRELRDTTPIQTVLLEEKERRGLAAALNVGYSNATGEIVIKSDCDKSFGKEAILYLVRHFSDPTVGAVSGAVRISNQCNKEIGYLGLIERIRTAEARLDSTYVFSPICAFRRSVIELLDERSVADDAELALKIRRKGYKTLYEPRAIATETSPESGIARIRQKSRRAQGHIRLLFQNLDIMFNPKYGRFGLIIFPANFFMMVVSPCLVLSAILLALFSLYQYSTWYSLAATILIPLLTFLIYRKSWPKAVAGFIDSQLNLLVGLVTLIINGPEFKWEKDY